MRRILLAIGCLLTAGLTLAGEPDEWQPLFNGKNLEGWDTYLGPPPASVVGLNLEKNAKGAYVQPVGLNNDPTKVYTVVEEDGAPAMRISGEIFGAITTTGEFENYHLRLETKWGKKKWPPREDRVRDSGLLYHCVGPQGAGSKAWMKSFECQIQENDVGDFWSVAGVVVDVKGDKGEGKSPLVYRKDGTSYKGWTNRIIRNPRSEKPSGEWYTVEVYAVGQTAVHVCDGKTNMVLTGLRQRVGTREEPLTRGKLQLQSEGAEVFYRNIMIRSIQEIPSELLN